MAEPRPFSRPLLSPLRPALFGAGYPASPGAKLLTPRPSTNAPPSLALDAPPFSEPFQLVSLPPRAQPSAAQYRLTSRHPPAPGDPPSCTAHLLQRARSSRDFRGQADPAPAA